MGGGGFGTSVGIVDCRNAEFGPVRNRQGHANQAFIEEKAVGGTARCECGHICAGAVGAVNRTEDWIEAMTSLKTLLHMRGGNGPCIADHMTRGATPAVGA